eukprot:15148217-Alexandrium_andersonii.AAC.1
MAGTWFAVAFLVAWSFQWHRGLRTHVEAAGLEWPVACARGAQLVLAGPELPDGGLGGWLPSCNGTCSARGAQLCTGL